MMVNSFLNLCPVLIYSSPSLFSATMTYSSYHFASTYIIFSLIPAALIPVALQGSLQNTSTLASGYISCMCFVFLLNLLMGSFIIAQSIISDYLIISSSASTLCPSTDQKIGLSPLKTNPLRINCPKTRRTIA